MRAHTFLPDKRAYVCVCISYRRRIVRVIVRLIYAHRKVY